MKGNFISLVALIDRLKTNPLLGGLDFDIAVRHAVDCMKLIGSKEVLTNKTRRVGISDYKGEIPLDIISLAQIRQVINVGADNEYYLPLHEASETFHQVKNKSRVGDVEFNPRVYSVNNYFIYTSFDEGVLDINYLGIAIDADGYPLIPDDAAIIKAIENYIKQEYYRILWELGKIGGDVFSKVEQEYCWYVGKAQSAAAIMSLDEREAISNIMNKLFIERGQHDEFYKNLGTTERLRTQ